MGVDTRVADERTQGLFRGAEVNRLAMTGAIFFIILMNKVEMGKTVNDL